MCGKNTGILGIFHGLPFLSFIQKRNKTFKLQAFNHV